jgi:hypothetical protein
MVRIVSQNISNALLTSGFSCDYKYSNTLMKPTAGYLCLKQEFWLLAEQGLSSVLWKPLQDLLNIWHYTQLQRCFQCPDHVPSSSYISHHILGEMGASPISIVCSTQASIVSFLLCPHKRGHSDLWQRRDMKLVTTCCHHSLYFRINFEIWRKLMKECLTSPLNPTWRF